MNRKLYQINIDQQVEISIEIVSLFPISILVVYLLLLLLVSHVFNSMFYRLRRTNENNLANQELLLLYCNIVVLLTRPEMEINVRPQIKLSKPTDKKPLDSSRFVATIKL